MLCNKAAFLAVAVVAALATATSAQDLGRQLDPNKIPRIPTPDQPTVQDLQAQPGKTMPDHREVLKPVIGTNAPGLANNADSQLAACLVVDNQGEIQLGKLAQERAKDKDVKQFAEQMVKEHSAFMQQLERFAGAPGQGPNARNDRPLSADAIQQGAIQATTDRPQAGGSAQAIGSQGVNFVALKQQIGQKCIEMVSRELKEKQGTKFDKCYIGGQIGAHMHVLATLEVFRNQASPELASVLDKGIETTKMHLEHAQSIAKALDSQSSSETAQRDSSSRNQ